MNDLLVRVNCTHKLFKLTPPSQRCVDYQIRFTPPRPVREALGVSRIERTTGTAQLAPAKKIAAQIIESHWSTDSAHMCSIRARSTEERQKFPLLSEVLEVFKKGAQSVPDKELMPDYMVKHYCNVFRRIVETRFDQAGRATRQEGLADRLTIDKAVNPKLWQDYMSGRVRSVGRKDPLAVARARRSANSDLSNARVVFAREFMPLYSRLNMPDLRPLREVRKYQDCAGGVKFRGIPQGTLDAMQVEIESLRQYFDEKDQAGQLTRRATDARGVYLGFFMCLYLGMRRSEVCNARLEWITEFGGMPKMEIVRREYFTPKGTEGAVPIGPQQLAELRTLSGAVSPRDYLIPGPDRRRTWDRLSKIVRKYLGDRMKSAHELRKQAISIFLAMNNGDLQACKEFSRHADTGTIEEHYADFLGRDKMRPITSTNWQEQEPSNVVPLPPQKAVL